MRAYWFLVAVLCMNAASYLFTAPIGSNGHSIAYYLGTSVSYDNALLNSLNNTAHSFTSAENSTVNSGLASSLFIFGDILGAIGFFLTLVITVVDGPGAIIYNIAGGASWCIPFVLVATAVTAIIYIAALWDMMRGSRTA